LILIIAARATEGLHQAGWDNDAKVRSVGEESEIVTVTDPDQLREFGWKDPLPPSGVTADRSLWEHWGYVLLCGRTVGRSHRGTATLAPGRTGLTARCPLQPESDGIAARRRTTRRAIRRLRPFSFDHLVGDR
jgi:hypothetical protein